MLLDGPDGALEAGADGKVGRPGIGNPLGAADWEIDLGMGAKPGFPDGGTALGVAGVLSGCAAGADGRAMLLDGGVAIGALGNPGIPEGLADVCEGIPMGDGNSGLAAGGWAADGPIDADPDGGANGETPPEGAPVDGAAGCVGPNISGIGVGTTPVDAGCGVGWAVATGIGVCGAAGGTGAVLPPAATVPCAGVWRTLDATGAHTHGQCL